MKRNNNLKNTKKRYLHSEYKRNIKTLLNIFHHTNNTAKIYIILNIYK